MNLHYSQTIYMRGACAPQFDIPMNLHYSQTRKKYMWQKRGFDIPMNLHYSQTYLTAETISKCLIFLWIYTTLKQACKRFLQVVVWYSYEFTLLSNIIDSWQFSDIVWYSYEFTLLSNFGTDKETVEGFDIPMNLHYSQTKPAASICLPRFDIPMNLHYSQTYMHSTKKL